MVIENCMVVLRSATGVDVHPVPHELKLHSSLKVFPTNQVTQSDPGLYEFMSYTPWLTIGQCHSQSRG